MTLSGPFAGTDVQYWKTALANLIEFDLADAVPTYVEELNTYKDPNGNDMNIWDKHLGGHTFSYMTKLEKIIFPTCVEYISHESCEGCSSLIEAVLPENINEMSHSLFENCVSLKYVTIPLKVTYISSTTFKNCSSLETITIPTGIIEIGWQAFKGCI